MICLQDHDLLNYPTDLWYITIILKRFNYKIIYCKIMHFVTYCIINCHLMHQHVYHEVPNGPLQDRLFGKLVIQHWWQSALFLIVPSQKLFFNKKANVKNWHCCLQQMPSLSLASAWGSIVNLMFCFLLKCCFWSVGFQKTVPSIKPYKVQKDLPVHSHSFLWKEWLSRLPA